jgi:hypothetical protein
MKLVVDGILARDKYSPPSDNTLIERLSNGPCGENRAPKFSTHAAADRKKGSLKSLLKGFVLDLAVSCELGVASTSSDIFAHQTWSLLNCFLAAILAQS